MIDKEFTVDTDVIDEGFNVEPVEKVDEDFLVDTPQEEIEESQIDIDQEMQVDICTCGKCEECRQLELALVEGECTCTYDEVIKTDEEGNEYTERVLVTKCDYHKAIESINLKYDNYRLMENANINMDLWDLCKVVDGIIYTPNECNNSVDMQTLVTRIVESTL